MQKNQRNGQRVLDVCRYAQFVHVGNITTLLGGALLPFFLLACFLCRFSLDASAVCRSVSFVSPSPVTSLVPARG